MDTIISENTDIPSQPHLNPLITPSTEMGHREPMTINAFASITIPLPKLAEEGDVAQTNASGNAAAHNHDHNQARISWGVFGLSEVSLGPVVPYHSTPCGPLYSLWVVTPQGRWPGAVQLPNLDTPCHTDLGSDERLWECGAIAIAGVTATDRNFPCQTLKIRKVSIVVMGS
jgi:hypothetical protein